MASGGGGLAYQIGMLIGMPTQIAVRLSDELLDQVDQLVEQGVYGSRAAAVRAGLEAVTDVARRRAVDQAVVEAYWRQPQADADEAAALASLRESIEQEPW